MLNNKKTFIVLLYIFAAAVVLYLYWPAGSTTPKDIEAPKVTSTPTVSEPSGELPVAETFFFRGVALRMSVKEVMAIETGELKRKGFLDGEEVFGELYYEIEDLYGLRTGCLYLFNRAELTRIIIYLLDIPPDCDIKAKVAEIEAGLSTEYKMHRTDPPQFHFANNVEFYLAPDAPSDVYIEVPLFKMSNPDMYIIHIDVFEVGLH